MAQNTANTNAIIMSQNQGFQGIQDKLCQLELDSYKQKVSDQAAEIASLRGQVSQTAQTAQIIAVYGALMTRPHASLLAACLSLLLFSYTAADWVLTRLHNRRKFFFGIALVVLIILFVSPRYFIVSEILEMMLMAALIYPNKIPSQDPKGRKKIPMEEEQQTFKKAA
jgi:hypothetical protein